MKHPVTSDDAPSPAGPYSQAMCVGNFVFTAGQGPADPATGQVPAGIGAQTHQVLRNISAILRASQCGLDDVVKVTAHLADLNDFDGFNSAYAQYFNEPWPVRTTVGSQLLGILVEIDVIAVRPDRADRAEVNAAQ